mgnify:FL=1
MENVQWEQLNNDRFSVFIRDLSLHANTNLKHMIEDLENKTKTTQKVTKKKHLKKKDIIIQENEKKKYKQSILNDEKKLEFLLNEIDTSDPFQLIQQLKTEEIKNKFKLLLLGSFWKRKKETLPNIFILYYHMKDDFLDEYC